MLNLTNILVLTLLIALPICLSSIIININWINSAYINIPFSINFVDSYNFLFSLVLTIIFLVLVIYSKIYLVGSFNYPYFEYIYNIFFTSMLLLICSNNMITMLVS